MTRKFDAWAEEHGATFYPGAPRRTRRCSGTRCYQSIVDVPGDIDLAIILTGKARRHVRGGAAAQGEVRGDLRRRLLARPARRARSSKRRLDDARRSRATCACSARTRTSTRSRTSATTSTGPSIALDHPVRPPGPAGVPGPGARHPAHALGADRQRGRPRVRRLRRVLRRPARGRRDRLLHRGLQGRPHAHARRRPRGASCASRS